MLVLSALACLVSVALFIRAVRAEVSIGYGAFDLGVHRDAANALRDGEPIYGRMFNAIAGFSYPPFTALLDSVLLVAALSKVRWVWLILELVAVAWLSWTLLSPLRARLLRVDRIAFAVLFGAVALATIPFRSHLRFGQFNLFLLVLVVADVVLVERRRRSRGALLGLATAIKLTPGLFIVHWLLTNRRREATTAMIVFLLATGIGFAAAPSESTDYWTSRIREDPSYVELDATDNQTVRAMTERHDLPVGLATLGAAAVAALALVRARGAARHGDHLAAAAILSMGAILASPIGWIHHYVAVMLAAAVLAREGMNRPRYLLFAACLAAATFLNVPDLVRSGSGLLCGLATEWYLFVGLAIVGLLPWTERAESAGAHSFSPSEPSLAPTRWPL